MDELDRRILALLVKNARTTIKDIAGQVALTSPAVSERIRRMEKRGIIQGYTALVHPDITKNNIHALVSMSVTPADRGAFAQFLAQQPAVQRCFQVTGTRSHMVELRCPDIPALEQLLARLQKWGETSTQIILATLQGTQDTL